MTAWQKRMKADLDAAGYAPGTKAHYFRAARRLIDHFGREPDQLGPDDVRGYFQRARLRSTAPLG